MHRGEVWWMDFPPPPSLRRRGRDPHMVLLLSWDAGLRIRDRVTVAPLTTEIRDLDAEVHLSPLDGVPEHCVVNLDIIATVFYPQLTRLQTSLSDERMRIVERAMHVALGMGLPCKHSAIGAGPETKQ